MPTSPLDNLRIVITHLKLKPPDELSQGRTSDFTVSDMKNILRRELDLEIRLLKKVHILF